MARIDVNFNDSSDETAQPTGGVPTGEGEKNKKNPAKVLLGQAVVNMGKRALSYGASQYGNITGNYLMQNKIDSAIEGIGYASQILVGYATGGVVGGVVSSLAIATQIGITAFNYSTNQMKSNQKANYPMNIRGGLLNDKSR